MVIQTNHSGTKASYTYWGKIKYWGWRALLREIHYTGAWQYFVPRTMAHLGHIHTSRVNGPLHLVPSWEDGGYVLNFLYQSTYPFTHLPTRPTVLETIIHENKQKCLIHPGTIDCWPIRLLLQKNWPIRKLGATLPFLSKKRTPREELVNERGQHAWTASQTHIDPKVLHLATIQSGIPNLQNSTVHDGPWLNVQWTGSITSTNRLHINLTPTATLNP